MAVHAAAQVGAPRHLCAYDVVIVHFETPELLADCLDSVVRHGGDAMVSIVVVDNSISTAGRTGAAAAVATVASVVSARLYKPVQNLGYGAGANAGVAMTASPYVLVLNADTALTQGASAALLRTMARDPDIGVVGPRLIDGRGHVQPSTARFPTAARALMGETGLWKLPLLKSSDWRPFTDPGSAQRVDWVLGAALMFRREAFMSVKGFDQNYFLYFEEVDLCHRLADAGWTTWYAPTADVMHVGGASTARSPLASRRVMYRSLARYIGLHAPARELSVLRAVVVLVALLRLVRVPVEVVTRDEHPPVRQSVAVWRQVLSDALGGWR